MEDGNPNQQKFVAEELAFLFEIAKDRPEWVGKYFKNVNTSFPPKKTV